jgi:spore germination protein GerM
MRDRIVGATRLFPALLIIGAFVIVVAAAVSACSAGNGADPTPTPTVTVTRSPSPTGEATPTRSPEGTTRLSVYFLRGEELGVAERRVPRTTGVAVAAMRALTEGPNQAERTAGLGTALPNGTQLRGVSIDDGIALVDLSSRFAEGGGSLSMRARVAQVVYTLTQFPTVNGVRFALDGRSVTTIGGEGVLVERPQRRADWVDFEPAIFVEEPGVGAVLSSPFTLRGTALVFEGSFLASLRDDSGRRIVRAIMQASAGGPERGDFRRTIAYTTSARSGELIVYNESAEDGSRQNEVRIPVTFSR